MPFFFYFILAGILFTTTLRLAAQGCAILTIVHMTCGTLIPFGLDMDKCLLGVPFHIQMTLGLAWLVRALTSPIPQKEVQEKNVKMIGNRLGVLFY